MKKILVIDNDEDLLKIISVILKENNFEVKTISQWQHITSDLKTFSPDFIFLDLDLEGADGGEICKTLKLSGTVENVPVIIISAHFLPSEYLQESNAQGFLQKPFSSTAVLNTIDKYLPSRKMHLTD